MDATICKSTALASSLWLANVPEVIVKSVSSSLLQIASPLVLQMCDRTEFAVGLVLGRFAEMARLAGEFVDVVGEAPTMEVIIVLVTVLESVVVLGCKCGTFDTASGGTFVSSKEALSDVPLPEIVFSVEQDWTLSEDPISS